MSINSNRFIYLPKTCSYIVYIRVCSTSGISKGILSRWHLAPTAHLTFEKGWFRNKKTWMKHLIQADGIDDIW